MCAVANVTAKPSTHSSAPPFAKTSKRRTRFWVQQRERLICATHRGRRGLGRGRRQAQTPTDTKVGARLLQIGQSLSGTSGLCQSDCAAGKSGQPESEL